MVVETVARVRVGSGAAIEQLVCHPRLPLIAGLDSERPAVHIWDCADGQLHHLGTVHGGSAGYGEAFGWNRMTRTPAAAWHPEQALLMVAGEGTLVRWTPTGQEDLPITAGYRSLAFGPDGQTLWASPSSTTEDNAWEFGDVIDLGSGTVGTGRGWDTGVTAHPGGGLVTTLRSDQGATLVLFARVTPSGTPTAMRMLRKALILEADGYQTPIFSADGRHLAIRGNAYENSLDVFAFPSLEPVLATTLGPPNPGYPYPQEWLEQMRAWSRHNIAFGVEPGVLWIGTPAGTLLEANLDSHQVMEHEALDGSPVTALAATAAGELVVAGGEGELVLVSTSSPAHAPGSDAERLRAMVTAFCESTSEVPDGGDLDEHVVLTDGERSWSPDDLASVTTADATDPSWLQIRSAVNNAHDRNN